MSENELKSSYGLVNIPKGTILYHNTDNSYLEISKSIPLLFTTLHPSDWSSSKNIFTIELQRDINLLFMVDKIKETKIFSALSIFLGHPNSNITKTDSELVKFWIPNLIKEQLDGWFTSIENKNTVEFAIISDPTIFKIKYNGEIKANWNNSVVPKKWGKKYPISSITKPFTLILNTRFKSQIESYLRQIERDNPDGTVFSIMLKNAKIVYFESSQKEIRWHLPANAIKKRNTAKKNEIQREGSTKKFSMKYKEI